MSPRKTYESKKDRRKERKVADRISSVWGCLCKKLPRKYEMDYALCIDKGGNWNERYQIKAFIEIKCRTISSTAFQTVVIGIEKWLKALDLYESTNIPCYLIYKFTDDTYYYKFDPHHKPYVNITMGGRKDRKDWQDHEPVVHIPISLMVKI